MQVQDIMTPGYETISATETIARAALIMRDQDVGMLPVVGDDGSLVGAVTDRDIVVRGLAEGREPDSPVEQVMTPGVLYCSAEDDVEAMAEIMEEHQVRRMIVVGEEHTVVGVVSLGDVATRGRDTALGGEVLEKVSLPAD